MPGQPRMPNEAPGEARYRPELLGAVVPPAIAAVAPIGLNIVPAGGPSACPAFCIQDRNLFRSARSIHPDEEVHVLY